MTLELALYTFAGISLATIAILLMFAARDPFFNPHPGWCCLMGIASGAQIGLALAISTSILVILPQLWMMTIPVFLGCYLGLVKLSLSILI